jgi:hypothetical protein
VRIDVIGECATAETLRGYLAGLGYSLSQQSPAYRLRIEESMRTNILLEGVRGPLADEAQHAMAELAAAPIEWHKASAGSENELHVVTNAAGHDAVERGLLRALLRLTRHGSRGPATEAARLVRRFFSR